MIHVILPNKEKSYIKENTTYIDYTNAPFYVATTSTVFDPNLSSSPPNLFINSLQKRMDIYYEKKSDKTKE